MKRETLNAFESFLSNQERFNYAVAQGASIREIQIKENDVRDTIRELREALDRESCE